jgi:putative transposase
MTIAVTICLKISRKEIAFLGITSSPAFVRGLKAMAASIALPAYSRKICSGWGDFSAVEELNLALIDLKHTYNEYWIIQGHGYKTPALVRQEQLQALPLAARFNP